MIIEFRNGNNGTFSWLLTYFRLPNKRRATFINFRTFFLCYVLIKGCYVSYFFNFEIDFKNIWLIINSITIGGYVYIFKWLCLLFYSHFSRTTFVQGATSIPDSRVEDNSYGK